MFEVLSLGQDHRRPYPGSPSPRAILAAEMVGICCADGVEPGTHFGKLYRNRSVCDSEGKGPDHVAGRFITRLSLWGRKQAC